MRFCGGAPTARQQPRYYVTHLSGKETEEQCHRTSKHGTFRLDRRFPGVGRVAVASGATTATEFHKRDALLTRLYDQGRLDLLRAIQAGTLNVTEVYAADRSGQLDTLTGDRALLGTN